MGYARVGPDEGNLLAQGDALAAEGCVTVYWDVAADITADRPQWQACLDALRPGDTLIIWKIDRICRSLHDFVGIVAALDTRGVAVKALTNAVIDTATAHGKLAFGIFALLAEHEDTFVRERTLAELAVARARGRAGGRYP